MLRAAKVGVGTLIFLRGVLCDGARPVTADARKPRIKKKRAML